MSIDSGVNNAARRDLLNKVNAPKVAQVQAVELYGVTYTRDPAWPQMLIAEDGSRTTRRSIEADRLDQMYTDRTSATAAGQAARRAKREAAKTAGGAT